jgi:hypothetical protein
MFRDSHVEHGSVPPSQGHSISAIGRARRANGGTKVRPAWVAATELGLLGLERGGKMPLQYRAWVAATGAGRCSVLAGSGDMMAESGGGLA